MQNLLKRLITSLLLAFPSTSTSGPFSCRIRLPYSLKRLFRLSRRLNGSAGMYLNHLRIGAGV